jgi:hypothetical protein
MLLMLLARRKIVTDEISSPRATKNRREDSPVW